jgi:hypothetical protein
MRRYAFSFLLSPHLPYPAHNSKVPASERLEGRALKANKSIPPHESMLSSAETHLQGELHEKDRHSLIDFNELCLCRLLLVSFFLSLPALYGSAPNEEFQTIARRLVHLARTWDTILRILFQRRHEGLVTTSSIILWIWYYSTRQRTISIHAQQNVNPICLNSSVCDALIISHGAPSERNPILARTNFELLLWWI